MTRLSLMLQIAESLRFMTHRAEQYSTCPDVIICRSPPNHIIDRVYSSTVQYCCVPNNVRPRRRGVRREGIIYNGEQEHMVS